MPGKMARSTLDQAPGLPEVLVALSTSGLSCKSAGKTRALMPVWDSSGESRLKSNIQVCETSASNHLYETGAGSKKQAGSFRLLVVA